MLKRHFSKRANSIRCVYVNRLHEFVGGLTFIIVVGDAHSDVYYSRCDGMRGACADQLKISHTFYGVNMHKINERSLHNSTQHNRSTYI